MEKRILVVDDDPAVLKAMTRLLEVYGYSCLTATGGNPAFKLLDNESNISFIISDMRMPDGDGLQLLKNLKHSGSKIPFLLVSGFADVSQEEIKELGAIDILSKPFDPDKLFSILEEHGA